ncbi:LysE family translocator [Nocardioides sp.]|uniref:LysE family translocator n=1 Tax=Nocardioides sp. TaxID=35761 RepID=UPI003513674F
MTPAFLVTALVIVATPGTGALYTIATGLARGARAAVVAAFACTLGIVPHLVAAITGLAALLHASGVAFAVLKWAGVAYLLLLAWSTWRDDGELAPDALEAPAVPLRRVLAAGITLNLLNPKLTLFFVAFLPQFAGPGELGTMLALSAVFMALTFVVFVGYGVFAAAMRDRVLRRPSVMTWLRRIFAATFVALGARLAAATR